MELKEGYITPVEISFYSKIILDGIESLDIVHFFNEKFIRDNP